MENKIVVVVGVAAVVEGEVVEEEVVVGQCDLDLGSSHYIYSRHRSATHLDRSTPTSLTC